MLHTSRIETSDNYTQTMQQNAKYAHSQAWIMGYAKTTPHIHKECIVYLCLQEFFIYVFLW